MVILLQQMLRGRTVQTKVLLISKVSLINLSCFKMFEGKNRRIELIRELQTTHALQVHAVFKVTLF